MKEGKNVDLQLSKSLKGKLSLEEPRLGYTLIAFELIIVLSTARLS